MAELQVAFLRGINLGKRRIKMDELRKVFDDLGLKNAQTLIASGNVLFEAESQPPHRELITRIENGIEQRFGFLADTIIRSVSELEALAAEKAFADWPDSDSCKRYVYFLDVPWLDGPKPEDSQPGDFTILGHQGPEILAIGHKQGDGRFGPGLEILQKRLPRHMKMTNRNWNTIERMIDKARL